MEEQSFIAQWMRDWFVANYGPDADYGLWLSSPLSRVERNLVNGLAYDAYGDEYRGGVSSVQVTTLAALKRAIEPGTVLMLVHSPGFAERRLVRRIVRVSSVGFYYTGDGLNCDEKGYQQPWPKARNFEPTVLGFRFHDDHGRSSHYLEYEWTHCTADAGRG